MATGVLMPVRSMSNRFRIGWVHTFGKPGNWSSPSISVCSCSRVIPDRHCSRGFKVTVVFTMPIGVLSVEVVPRPTVPNTLSTSGNFLSTLSWTCSSLVASVIDRPGGDVGMYNCEPS